MARSWKFIVGILLLVLAGSGGYFTVRYFKNFSELRMKAIRAVPSSSIAFIETNDIKEAIYPFFNADFWEPFRNIKAFRETENQYQHLDSLLKNYGGFNEILEQNMVIWALHPLAGKGLASLAIIELPPAYFDSDIRDFIEETNGQESIVMKTDYRDAQEYTVNLFNAGKIFYFSVFRGLFLASFDRDLLHLSIDELYKEHPLTTERLFNKIRTTAGKNVPLNLYIRLPGLLDWISENADPKIKNRLNSLQGLGDWSETDMLIHSDNILLNGYTICSDTLSAGLGLFKQPPGSVLIPKILPNNVNWMIHYSIQNTQVYFDQRNANKAFAKELKLQEEKLETQFSINLKHDFANLFEGEIAVADIATSGSAKGGKLVIMQTKDIIAAVLNLEKISEKINRKLGSKVYKNSYEEFTIRALPLEGIFKPLFGKAFPDFKTNYYLAIKDYLVFSDDPNLLIHLLKQYYARNTLAEDVNYKSFSNNISDKSNIYLYANLQRSYNQIPGLFNDFVQTKIEREIKSLSNFEAVALQFSYINQMFYTNVFIKYNPDYQEVIPDSWEIALDSPIQGKPFLVPNHRSGKLNVLVADKNNQVYLLDHVGNIQWSKTLPEAVVGDVHAIDFYGNKKVQYLFNTTNFIYLLDINGDDVEDYPHELPAPASGPVAVFDYNNDNDYRMLIGLTDNRIYNWDKYGKSVEGWDIIETRSEVESPVQHLVCEGKDYLFVTDNNGQVLMCDRRGEQRIKLKQSLIKAKNSIFYVNKTNSKGLFVTTDNTGQLIYVTNEGTFDQTSFGTYSANHYFFYSDVDNNGSYDFIFIDGNQLKIFDRFKKLMVEQDFPEIISQPPVLYQSGGKQVIGILLPVLGEIRLYSVNGRLFENLSLKGSVPFTTGSIQGDLKLNLITGIDKRVINYSLSPVN